MSFLLFVDESGHDQKSSPYQVLAGIAIEDRDLWNLIQKIQDLEVLHFGLRITQGALELKGRKLLKRKVFRLASQLPAMPPAQRRQLAKSLLDKTLDSTSPAPTREELTALGQAKIAFVAAVLEACAQYRVRAFASIVDKSAPKPAGDLLRKDYAYLLERYFYFLEDHPGQMGLVIFDELEKSQCHLLVDQLHRYFLETTKGKVRSATVIPEPFFVHSDLTTAVQVADLIAYITAWGVKVHTMDQPRRSELETLADLVCQLRHRAVLENIEGHEKFNVWSFALIDDLRPRHQRTPP